MSQQQILFLDELPDASPAVQAEIQAQIIEYRLWTDAFIREVLEPLYEVRPITGDRPHDRRRRFVRPGRRRNQAR